MSLVSRTAGGPENAITDGLSGLSAGGGNPADMKAQGGAAFSHSLQIRRCAGASGNEAYRRDGARIQL